MDFKISDSLKTQLEYKLFSVFFLYLGFFTFTSLFLILQYFYFPYSEQLSDYTITESRVSLLYGLFFLVILYIGDEFKKKQNNDFKSGTKSNCFNSFSKYLLVTIILNVILLFATSYYLNEPAQFNDDLSTSIKHYKTRYYGLDIDNLQYELKCCEFLKPNVKEYPLSCCRKKSLDYKCTEELAYRKTCKTAYFEITYHFRASIVFLTCLSVMIQLFTYLLYYKFTNLLELVDIEIDEWKINQIKKDLRIRII